MSLLPRTLYGEFAHSIQLPLPLALRTTASIHIHTYECIWYESEILKSSGSSINITDVLVWSLLCLWEVKLFNASNTSPTPARIHVHFVAARLQATPRLPYPLNVARGFVFVSACVCNTYMYITFLLSLPECRIRLVVYIFEIPEMHDGSEHSVFEWVLHTFM